MTKTELIEKLADKVDTERKEYEELLRKMDVDGIITMSYETVIKEQLCWLLKIETGKMLEECQIEKMLNIDNLLDCLYQGWLKFDSDEYNILKEFVFGHWDKEELR